MIEKGIVVGGRYRLVKQIGHGGMATVWEAEHMTLGSPVAVKFLYTAGPKAEEMVGRFMREARVAAAVRHRNVIEITDFGLSDDAKTPYMVMELLDGESLADRLDRQRVLEPQFATQIIWLALRGLAAVHDAGIVHRDLKPENIYLVTDADGTYPKILDFGVSREQEDDTNITKEGILIGTPSYMSPEQARGLRDLDLLTDIYSMGVILYELLAGRLPFESENPGDLIVMITRDRAPALRNYCTDLPEGIYKWIERAMAKDRAHRFRDAREMRWALADACQAFGFGVDQQDSGGSRVFDLASLSGSDSVNSSPPPRNPGITEFDVPVLEVAANQRLSLEELATIQTREPVATPERVVPTERPRAMGGRGSLLLGGALLATATVVGVALVIPQSPFAQKGLTAAVFSEASPAVPWEPEEEAFPAGFLAPPAREPGVHVLLFAIPDGAIAQVDGVGIEGGEAWMPISREAYRVDIWAEGEKLWSVAHPGNVDGEYEVWPMSAGELAELDELTDSAEGGREATEAAPRRPRMVRGRTRMTGPRRRPSMPTRMMRRR